MTKKRLCVSVVAIAAVLFSGVIALCARQNPTVRLVDQKVLREYTGAYQWGPNAFVYLQMWDEFTTIQQWLAKRVRGFAP